MVDATQGVEAQTLANTLLALENDLELVPVLNKIEQVACFDTQAACRETGPKQTRLR